MLYPTTLTEIRPAGSKTPRLEPGDHLTRDEFERRYEAMPNLKKAELVEGVVYLPLPVRFEQHASPHATLLGWLQHYAVFTPGVGGGANSTVRLDLDNELQHDALMIREADYGGRTIVGTSGYIEGPPDLVGEVAVSTVSIDLHTKLRVCRRNKVQEYIVWRVDDLAIDWFTLKQGDYTRLQLAPGGVYRSEVFPGLWLDPTALVRGDLPTVLRVLREGIASPEHAAFVAELQKHKS